MSSVSIEDSLVLALVIQAICTYTPRKPTTVLQMVVLSMWSLGISAS